VLQMCITLHCRIDDIQDNSDLYRGIPAAHKVYGVASAISAAMYIIFVQMQRMLSTNQTGLIKLYTETMLQEWQWRSTGVITTPVHQKRNIWK